jgi:hypothetical protein
MNEIDLPTTGINPYYNSSIQTISTLCIRTRIKLRIIYIIHVILNTGGHLVEFLEGL